MSGFGYNVLGFGSGGEASLEPFNVNILVVAGGGGGGGGQAGGGGAGGYRYCTSYPIVGGNDYKVTVGAGGAGVCISPVNNTTPIFCRFSGSASRLRRKVCTAWNIFAITI